MFDSCKIPFQIYLQNNTCVRRFLIQIMLLDIMCKIYFIMVYYIFSYGSRNKFFLTFGTIWGRNKNLKAEFEEFVINEETFVFSPRSCQSKLFRAHFCAILWLN